MSFAIRKALLMVCCLAAALSVAACGAAGTTLPPHGYVLTRCNGSPIMHAAPGVTPPAALPAAYVGTQGSVGAGPNGVFAFAAESGSMLWCVHFALMGTYQCSSGVLCPPPPIPTVGTPLISGGVVYVCVSGAGGFTYAFNAADGALRWSWETGCGSLFLPYGGGQVVLVDDGQPILADGVLYSGSVGLDPVTGEVRWNPDLPVTIDAVSDGLVYAVRDDDTLLALSLPDGEVSWAYALVAPIGDRPAVFGNHLYVGDIKGDNPSPPAVIRGLPDTYALDARTGALRWRSPTGIVAGSSAVEADGLVYIGGDNALDALDAATGTIRWRVKVPYDGYVESTPIVADGTVYFTADGAYALDAVTGTIRWHNPLGWNLSTAFTGPALLGGVLYLGGIDGGGHGTVYALDAATGAVRWQHPGFNQLAPPAAA